MLRTEFQTIQNETTATLNACIQSLPAGKREPFQHLAVELGNYWSTIGPISTLGAKEKKELGNSVLRGRGTLAAREDPGDYERSPGGE